jgi:nitrate reductase assembly molybdenum cofactor insertion protein NarJ
MTADCATWDAFAGLLSYPGGNVARVRDEWAPCVIERWPDLAPELTPLLAHALEHSEGECEELFTRTFDGSAERALELGWHLHGENYARGVLLVRLRAALRQYAVDEGVELPDHVSNVLRLLGRVDAVTASALRNHVLVPALDKVIAGFADEENPYKHTLIALRSALQSKDATASALHGADAARNAP